MNKKKINKKKIAVIGLGYVGLPLACLASEKGYTVLGIGRNKEKLDAINNKKSPIDDNHIKRWLKTVEIEATDDFSVIKKAKIIIICVPTPVDDHYNPDLKPIKSVTDGIRKYLKKGQLVILESTVNPGVSEEIVLPILEKSGLKAGKDFYLAHCPERIDPGNKKYTVRNIPRVVGAYSVKGLKKAVDFYESILEAPVRPMKSLKEAEATKIIENSFRDINIAFVNEIARSFDVLGIDVLDVIEGAKTKPFAFMPHYPSCGIGGHCIPVDPYYLIEKARQVGFNHEFLKLGRKINNAMPEYTVSKLAEGLNEVKKPIKGTKIGLLGIAYKANVDDDRESPFYVLRKLINELGGIIEVYDPHILGKSTVKDLNDLLSKVDAVVLVTDHKEFKEMDLKKLKKYKIKAVIDGKNALDKEKIKKMGIIYKGIGR